MYFVYIQQWDKHTWLEIGKELASIVITDCDPSENLQW